MVVVYFCNNNAGVFQTGVTYHIENEVLFKSHHIPLIHLHDKAQNTYCQKAFPQSPYSRLQFIKIHFFNNMTLNKEVHKKYKKEYKLILKAGKS